MAMRAKRSTNHTAAQRSSTPADILLGHVGQLLAEDDLEAHQPASKSKGLLNVNSICSKNFCRASCSRAQREVQLVFDTGLELNKPVHGTQGTC